MVRALDLRLRRSRVRISAVLLSGNNLGQVVHARVPLSPSSITWYRSRDGNACSWEGNRRSGVALVMRHTLPRFIHLRAHDLRKGDEQPAYSPHGVWHSTYSVTFVCCKLWHISLSREQSVFSYERTLNERGTTRDAAAISRSMSPAGRSHSSKSAAAGLLLGPMLGQTDGRTLDKCKDPAPQYAGSANKALLVHVLLAMHYCYIC